MKKTFCGSTVNEIVIPKFLVHLEVHINIAGSTIIAERPYSSIIHPKNTFSFCQNCCHEVKNLVPCKECSLVSSNRRRNKLCHKIYFFKFQVVFCSNQCRSACQDYHQYECKFMKTLSTSEILGDIGRLCYRTICKTDILVLQSHVREYSTFQEKDFASLQKDEAETFRQKFTLGLDKSGKLDSRNYTSGKHRFCLKFSFHPLFHLLLLLNSFL